MTINQTEATEIIYKVVDRVVLYVKEFEETMNPLVKDWDYPSNPNFGVRKRNSKYRICYKSIVLGDHTVTEQWILINDCPTEVKLDFGEIIVGFIKAYECHKIDSLMNLVAKAEKAILAIDSANELANKSGVMTKRS